MNGTTHGCDQSLQVVVPEVPIREEDSAVTAVVTVVLGTCSRANEVMQVTNDSPTVPHPVQVPAPIPASRRDIVKRQPPERKLTLGAVHLRRPVGERSECVPFHHADEHPRHVRISQFKSFFLSY